ncbi:alpha/beta fold hydrolase [Sphingobium scionense]|uniref:2-hydroxymuconate-semialdehyde hydrolase n=2 Tax=Sphingomonadaceae TaxID=41297 RepID=A0A7W6LUC6_9SPHN|nr:MULTISPECIES: alpha/beta hydrolase [Sphingobium]ACV31379.1 putative 2-hydroxymuconic semialdehyde hydrolase [Sphingomonas sp. DN1]MBB4149602.1 2-hydroxymuconate-semialdehyde hydrolase [Sphingobium scionense]HUD94059.1 alpha/beta hydrolase [Sphingobium sp.]
MTAVANDIARPEIGKSITVDGSVTNYHDLGDGAPVLLIHGSGPGVTAWANWRLNMPELAKRFRVIAPDMFGFGYSASKGRIEDKRVWVDQVASLLDSLGIDKVSMVGNSFGGGITLAFMIAHPDRVERAVLMGPAGLDFPITPALDLVWGYQPSLEEMRASLKYLAWDHSRLTEDLVQSRYEASARPEAHEPYHATFGGADRQRNIAMLASREEDVAALKHETLILHGLFDQVIPLESTVRLASLLPRADLHVFAECGHWVQIERMASFNRMVTEFLENGLKA